MWYPKKGQDDSVPSLRASLTGLDPDQYHEVVYDWPIDDFIIWAEESRVMEEFRDMFDD